MLQTDFTSPNPSPISDFSPSLANQLLACALRTAFARDPAFRPWRRPSTYTALGLIAHAVTEAAFTTTETPDGDVAIRAAFEALWESETARAVVDLNEAWTPATLPPPAEWPGYALTRARTIRRAISILISRPIEQRPTVKGTGIEIELSDPTTGLFGRADRIERNGTATRVVDLKTGLRQDAPTAEQRRQLLLYAVLAHRTSGKWPGSIAVEDASGNQYVSPLDPNEAETALAEVQDAVVAFNQAAQTPALLVKAAEPTSDKCRWCAYRVVCAPYWVSLATDWNHRATLGAITESGAAHGGHYLGLKVESPADQSGRPFHLTHLPGPVPDGATQVAVVDWFGAPDQRDVRARWSTVLRAW